MTANKKTGQVATRPASNTAFTEHHSTVPDRLNRGFVLLIVGGVWV